MLLCSKSKLTIHFQMRRSRSGGRFRWLSDLTTIGARKVSGTERPPADTGRTNEKHTIINVAAFRRFDASISGSGIMLAAT